MKTAIAFTTFMFSMLLLITLRSKADTGVGEEVNTVDLTKGKDAMKSNTLNIELDHPQALTVSEPFGTKDEQSCWPGRTLGCSKPREWAVFHDKAEAELTFDYLASVYIGTCSEHLPLALRRDPTAINYVRPY